MSKKIYEVTVTSGSKLILKIEAETRREARAIAENEYIVRYCGRADYIRTKEIKPKEKK